MKIPNWISTNVLNVFTEHSRAYISNTTTKQIHWLNNLSSDIWYLIVQGKNYKEILNFAVSKEIKKKELDNFIKELKNLNLIQTRGKVKQQKTNSINLIGDINFKNETKKILTKWSKLNIQENKLSSILFDTTYRCNEKCIHCYCDKTDTKTEINFKDIKQIIDEAYELGITKITFTGGECTLIKDFYKICKYVRKKRIELILFTNGQKFYDEPDLLDKIINLYPYMIGISLYSMNPDIHDKITGVKGSWNKTITVIKKLLDNNILVEIKCFLTKYNADSYKDIINFAKENNCQLAIDSNLLANKKNNNFSASITDEQLEKFYKFAYENNLTQKSIKIDEDFLSDIPCQAGHTTIGIKPNLLITTCPNGNIILGDLKNKTLKELWEKRENNRVLTKWRNLKNKDFKDCFKYSYCKYCDFCPLKVSNEKSKKMLCNTAKIKMRAVSNNVSRL